ncbi:MAG: S-methyl-5-thioribose-1-phosphate isomerase [Chloroflexota bacterium]
MTAQPPDPSRRRFFRQLASEVVGGAAKVAGAVGDLRERSAAEASALFGDDGEQPAGATAAQGGITSGIARGFRTPFRFESDDVLLVIDQRRLPEDLIEIPVRSAPEAAAVIREMAVRGAPAIGQVGAIGLALSARLAREASPFVRRAIIHAAAATLVEARPTAVNLRWATDRLLARYRDVGETNEDGGAVANALHDEAMAIVAEATEDHGRLAEAGLAILPRPEGRALQVLTHCNTGPLAAGQYGTALGVVQAAHYAERPIHVWVDETRPYLQGARLTTWELGQAGVPHTLIPDMAAGAVMARGDVDVVLVGADRIAANGDTANKIGTYTLAVLAARHDIPFIFCAPLSSVDLETADGSAIPIEDRSADEVRTIRGVAIAPPGTPVHNPAFDITPAALITAIVTEEGVLLPPFGPALAAAVARRAERRRAATPETADPRGPAGVVATAGGSR